MQTWFIKRGVAYCNGLRAMALVAVLLVTAVFAVFAFNYEGGYDNYAPVYYRYYELEDIIHIEASDEYSYYNHYVAVELVPPTYNEAADYTPGGYIGIAPANGNGANGAGRLVTFNPNGGQTPPGHESAFTIDGGILGALPLPPLYDGHFFMWWSTDPLGRDSNVLSFGDVFDENTYIPEGGLTVFAVWGFEVHFHGNGIALPATSPDIGSNPNSFVPRRIPNTWSFDEAQDFGLPVAFPINATRPRFEFWGWYSISIPLETTTWPAPAPAVAIDRYTTITGLTHVFARWRLHTHLVMFDMNIDYAELAVGTSDRPQRLYRWVLHERSIADSGLGGDPITGLGVPGTIPSTIPIDGPPWNAHGIVPQLWYRQNIQRPWVPNAPFGDPTHIPRWNADSTFNSAFTTPYYPGSNPRLVRGDAAGAIDANAGTMNPRSAPTVNITDPQGMWIPGGGGSNAISRARYTLEGWWTTPDGWAENTSGTIASRRFAPAAMASTHTSVSLAPDDTTATGHANPQGFPTGVARPAQDSLAMSPAPPTGIVTGDMTVYAMWVYRVTFDLNHGFSHGQQGFSLSGTSVFNPHRSTFTNYRDILPSLPPEQRTINLNGRRIRFNDGANGVTHEPVPAGFPPYSSPNRPAHAFNGWWDRPIPPVIITHYNNCLQCATPFCYPAVHHGATRITGDTQIDGSMTAYAHWRYADAGVTVTVIFNLNSDLIADTYTEGVRGYAYWPTHRPYDNYANLLNRFFLSRGPIPELGIGVTSTGAHMPILLERNHRYTASNHNMERANVHYDDRYEASLVRHYPYNQAINANTPGVGNVQGDRRMPRNPRRAGYLFVGWALVPDLPPLTPAGAARAINDGGANAVINPNNIWNPGRSLNNSAGLYPGAILELYAVWAPAIDLIFVGNGNTGHLATSPAANQRFTNAVPPGEVITEIVRPMAIGYTFNQLLDSSRGGSASNGTTWIGNFFNLGAAANDSNQLRFAFQRPNFLPLLASTVFNSDQHGRHGYGRMILAGTQFNMAFFDDPTQPSNRLQERPDGSLYLRIYQQWGGTLTFEPNHGGAASRTVTIPAGRTVNHTLSQITRNLNTPNTANATHPWGDGSTWLPNPAPNAPNFLALLDTRGGWPHDPYSESPPRNFDVSGGDWYALFATPRSTGSVLVGWHRYSTGVCPTCQTDPLQCPWDGVHWVDANTPIYGNNTIYAIWNQEIIFLPGTGGNAVNMDNVFLDGNLARPLPPGPLFRLHPPPGNPTWGAAEFLGWFATPYFDRAAIGAPAPFNFGDGISTGDPIPAARRFYAVFGATVNFHPSGPGSLVSNGFFLTPGANQYVYTPWAHVVGDHIRIQHYVPGSTDPHLRPSRPGWGNEHFTYDWFALADPNESYMDPDNRMIFRPAGHPDGAYGEVTGNMDMWPIWRSHVTFRPGHVRGRLDGLTTNAEVIRRVPELLPISSNPTGQRVPAVTSATAPGWANDPGLRFVGWRKVNAAGQPLVYYDGGFILASPSTPIPIWTCAEVEAFRVTGPLYFFEAVWQLQLEFYKVSMVTNNDHPLGHNPLQGARFVLYHDDPNIGWVQAYPPLSADPNDPRTFVESDADGRVSIGINSTDFSPGLILPSMGDWPASGTITFKLREILAPEGYITPGGTNENEGHWLVTISRDLGQLPVFTAIFPPVFGGNLNFQVANITYGSWEGIRQFVRNMPYDFDFWKTNVAGGRLAGANLRLFVYNGVGTPQDELITQAMLDADIWTMVGYGISTLADPITFRMLPDRYYRLVEVAPPAGHQMPMGQWHLSVNSTMPATSFPTLSIARIGNISMPDIVPITPFSPQTYLVHNWLDFELPLSGGGGTNMYVIAGTLSIMIAAGLMLFNKYKRESTTV